MVTVLPVPPDVTEVVLASDGYRDVLPTLAATERRLAEQLAVDPWCIGPLRGTKAAWRGASASTTGPGCACPWHPDPPGRPATPVGQLSELAPTRRSAWVRPATARAWRDPAGTAGSGPAVGTCRGRRRCRPRSPPRRAEPGCTALDRPSAAAAPPSWLTVVAATDG